MIEVLLAHDNSAVRDALAAALRQEATIDLQLADADADALWARLLLQPPRLLLAAIDLPPEGALSIARRLRERAIPTRVVVLVPYGHPGLHHALDAGVHGYLTEDMPTVQLLDALHRIDAGERALDPLLQVAAWESQNPLSAREIELLRRVGDGEDSASIAQRLGIQPGTVRNYLSGAMRKLGASNRLDAWRIARARGWA